MNDTALSIIIVIVYIITIVEIVFFSVPSVASTGRLFARDQRGMGKTRLLARVRMMSRSQKFMLLVVPDVFGILAFLTPLVLILFPGLQTSIRTVTFPGHDYIRVVAVILLIVGRGVSLSAVPLIRGEKRMINTDEFLITAGIFRITRNPIALGMNLTFLGLFIILPSPVLFTGLLIYMANMHFRILLEEDYMGSRYGNQYEEYLRNVRRYF